MTSRANSVRIGDVTALERARVQNGKLFLYTQKTGTPVYLPLPEFVCRGTSPLRRAPKARFGVAGPFERKDHCETLCTPGTGAAGANGERRQEGWEGRSVAEPYSFRTVREGSS
jgi:hypothetical protein